ncbi:LANO_0G01904g1_1 [Lachancea nothofagi CBS 11611]|uniref:Sterol 3-beta-glucosyltransferase n=1 Tax=Lachancea nothofagi CBS 11611 TaxID=1266666 RepID=A0A1G4KF63_9SACH|nr:LANO_0G01904g1_1 [Lachancea nothofagi CBS 11611]
MPKTQQSDPADANIADQTVPVSNERPSQNRWLRSLSPVGKLYHSSAGLVHLRGRNSGAEKSSLLTPSSNEPGSLDSGNKDQDPDLARPCGMAKSIVGLLTTASVYAGMGDLEQAEGMCGDEESNKREDEDEDQEEASEEYEDEVRKLDEDQLQAVEAERVGTCGSERDDGSSDSLRTASDLDSLADTVTHISKKDSLFEISVVSNNDAQSIASTDSRSRQSKIYRKLLSRFNLNEAEDEFVLKYSCWLLKDLLIQGHILLTTRHLLFFAFLPKNTGTTKMSGNLSTVAGGLGGRRIRYWAVLKDHTLSLYNSLRDLYFPLLTIDLRYASRIELTSFDEGATGDFKIHTEVKVYKLRADSKYAARSWCSALKKQLFATQNSENDSMSIKIPLANIIDVDEQIVVAQSVTLRVRVLESPQSFAVDDYFFMFLNKKDIDLKEIINDQLSRLERTQHRSQDTEDSFPFEASTTDATTGLTKRVGRGRSTSSSKKIIKRVLSPVARVHRHSFSVSMPFNPRSPQRVMGLLRSKTETQGDKSTLGTDAEQQNSLDTSLSKNSDSLSSERVEHPLQSTFDDETSSEVQDEDKGRGLKLANWAPRPIKNVGNMWGAHPVHYKYSEKDMFSDDDQYLASSQEQAIASKRFRSHFSLRNDEMLRAAYYTHLNKNIPIYGKFYLGSSVICFRSLIPGTRTKMILPIKDIENCFKERGFRFGYFGLVLVIHGHEELFFEFSLQSSRDDAEFVILKQIDGLKSEAEKSAGEVDGISQRLKEADISTEKKITEAAKLRMFEDKINAEGYDLPMMIEESPYYKTSITPKKSYKFGLLTIGSRGDVQPYIALGKGLLKEGHRVTIITHAEFGDWIKSYGLDFKEIAGNPAELMSLMVQHGSMNVGMLREASSRFRGWITKLLETSWSACQNLDILIESPSAMAGIHIAEALMIPYFRAFTMPWTRTRAYPHAFIVPDQKRGGNYNFFTHVLFENIFWKGIGGQVNKWRIETLGLGKTNLDLMQQNKVPFLYNISPAIFAPSVDFSEWVKVTGYWFLDAKDDFEPPAALIEFIARAKTTGKKLVYIGFGSIVISDPKKMTRAVVDAVLEADVFCVLNKGWSDRLEGESEGKAEEEFPSCIYSSGSVPHDWLFPQVDAAVHHGGSGTTGATLRAGLPTVIKPFFGDQFFYAGRVEDIGAGISLKKLNSKTLSRALKEVTTNSRIVKKAQQIKREISKENGVHVAISCIYSELEYARSLVMAKNKDRKSKNIASPEENTWFLV